MRIGSGTAGLGEPMRQILSGQAGVQLAIVQRINAPKFLSGLDKFCNVVSRVLNGLFIAQDVNDKVLSLPPSLIVHVRKTAHDLAGQEFPGRVRPRSWSRKQAHMKGRAICPVNQGSFFEPNKRFSAVRTLFRV